MQDPSETIMVSEEVLVKSRLDDFGLTKSDIAKICQAALNGKSLSSALQPKTAEGLLKYIFGVEGLREVCLSLQKVKYKPFSKTNLEGVLDAVNGRKIMFQMVDLACAATAPQPKSKIGEAKRQFIEQSKQPSLFPEWDKEDRVVLEYKNALESAECWYVIVSIDEDNVVCCELSRPKSVVDDKFLGFHERVQVFKYGEFALDDIEDAEDTEDAFEIKPSITKK